MSSATGRVVVSRIEIEPLRKVPNEARHFTTWLAEYIDALAERVGLELTVIEREKAVGDSASISSARTRRAARSSSRTN